MLMSRPLSLVHAPYPFPRESAASWIHRTCQFHGVTYRTLAGYLCLKPVRDPDLATSHDHVCRIGAGTGVSPKRLKELADVFNVVRQHPQLKQLLNFERKTPTYRFCPQCLATDLVPYLRIEWRFKDWNFCPEHRCRMSDCCPTCRTKIRAAKPCISSSSDEPVSILHCAACKKPLATLGDEVAREVWVSPAKLTIQRAIVSAVRSGIFRIDGLKIPLPLAFMIWIKDNRDVVKECISRGAHRPENERPKFIMTELIESYCIQRGSRKSLEELLHRRKRWMKKKRTCRAEACYEDFISRQAARQSEHEDGEPAGKPTQST
ncbi:TniQ family protein [Ralstonia solanacearum]|uniref:TniQ family protein n=1 Tax=Ralstonia solanacearum TaxID=305 RepID=UPI0039E00030